MKTVYAGRFMTVVEEPIGALIYERAIMRPSVQVIPFTKDGLILMIRERRLEEGQTRWKFVSGFMDKEGFSEEEVAQEELMEEAGFEAGRLERYFNLKHNHTFCIPITYFLAFDLKEKKKPNPDGDVVEEVRAFSIDELFQRVLDGEFDFLHEASVIMKLYRDVKNSSLKF